MNALLLSVLAGIGLALPPAAQDPHAHHHDEHTSTSAHVRAIAPPPRTPLGDRIAAARAGDTLRLAAGVHRGPIVVDRRVVLLGTAGAIIDGGGAGTVVTLAGDSAELRSVIVRGGGFSLDRDDAGVKLVACHGCRVLDVDIEGTLHGVYVLESNDVELARNRVRGEALRNEGRRGNGIHVYNSIGTRITDNRISVTRDGIYFSFASGSDVEGNEVTGVRYGLHYMYSDDNRFARNRFTRNAAGAAIMFSKRIRFEENVFSEHTGSRAYGILLQTSDHIVAIRNRIEDNLVGVFLDNAMHNVFRENRIAGNGTGIDFIPSAEANTFTENVIAGNRTSVRKAIGGGENSFSAAGRGNYWGDGAVFDLDGDGIGDRPYRAVDPFSALAAARPVLEAFAMTPAARALSWAERAFPVFDLPTVEDPYPLSRPPASLAQPEAAAFRAPYRATLALLIVPFAVLVAGIRTLANGRATPRAHESDAASTAILGNDTP